MRGAGGRAAAVPRAAAPPPGRRPPGVLAVPVHPVRREARDPAPGGDGRASRPCVRYPARRSPDPDDRAAPHRRHAAADSQRAAHARRLDRHAVPDGVHRSARVRDGDPVSPRDGAASRRRRLRRDHARRRLLDHAVPVHPDLGTPVGSDRAAPGAALEHRRHRGRDGVRRRGAVAAAVARGARVQRRRHREHRGRAGLRRRRDPARTPRPRHGHHRHRVWPRLHPRPGPRRPAVAISGVRTRGVPARLRGRRAGGGELPARAAHAAGVAAARAPRQVAAARGAAGPRRDPHRRRRSRHRRGGRGQLRDGALVRRDGADVRALHRRRVRHVDRRDRQHLHGRRHRRRDRAGRPRATARAAFRRGAPGASGRLHPGGGVRVARPVGRFRGLGRPGALHLGGVDRPRQRPDDAVAARLRVATRDCSPPRA